MALRATYFRAIAIRAGWLECCVVTAPMPVSASSSPAATIARSGDGRGMTRTMRILLVAYLLLIVTIMLLAQISITPDLFVLWTLFIAVLLGRGRAFLRDWLPLVAIFVAWESARGLSQFLATRVESDSIIAIERGLFFGLVPTVELQRMFHDPTQLSALNVTMSAVYLSHFLLPLAIGFYLWLKDRSTFFLYMTALMVVSFAAFFTAIALPVAPPRFSADYGEALAVRDVMADTFAVLGSEPSSWLYGNINGNPVAAFPSLHAAYPFLGFLFIRRHLPRVGWIVIGYTFVVWFAITYLGHHYVVDIVAGVGYAIPAYLAVTPRARRFYGRIGQRLTPVRPRQPGEKVGAQL